MSLLHDATERGDLQEMIVLIKNRICDVNTRNSHGNTPLHLACYSHSLDTVKFLLKTRCSTKIPNWKGEFARHIPLNENGDYLLHIACQWDDVDIVRYLITDERCNPNVQSSTSKNTPLHIAAMYGQDHTIIQLLCKECNPNTQNKEGDTPLHLAASSNKPAVVSKLLAHQQIDVNAQNKKGNTPLHMACYRKSLDIIKLLLERKCITNIPNKKGTTAQYIPLNEDGDCLLHIACQWDDVDIVRYLVIDERCNPNVQSSTSKNTPLHIAAMYGQDHTIIQLLCKECNPNTQNKEGDTPLHLAASSNKPAVVSKLLAHQQIDVNAQNKKGNTPLHMACYRKSLDIIKLLLERKCITNIPNKKGTTAQYIPLNEDGDCLLHIACQWGDVNIVRYLIIDERCDVNIQNRYLNTPVHIACQMGNMGIVQYILTHVTFYLDTQNTHQNTPLHIACYMKSMDIIKVFLEMNSSTNIPNKKGETAQDIPLNWDGDCLLHIACQWGDVNIVRYLITDEKCNPNVQSSTSENTPLHVAAKYGQDDTIAQLLSYKECNPNTQNKDGNTPLHLACYRRSLDVVKLFLERKCSTNIPNKKGDTAQNIPLNEDGECLLHIVCQWGDVDIVRYLITDERCNTNVQSYTAGNTPLHIAVKYGKDDIIVQLLSYDECDPIAQNKEGDTPLHIACYSKSLNIIKLLLEKKCSTNIPNKKGEIAQDIPLNVVRDCLLHIACQWGDVDIVRYLITHERCSPNVQSSTSENTPLHIAAKYGQDDVIVQLLLYDECDPIAQNKEGDTPLHIACYSKSLDIIKLLLEMKCSTNIPNKKGEIAQDIPLNVVRDCLLHIACQWGDVDIVRYLITDERCSPNVQSSTSENTPLHIAAKYGKDDTVVQLLSYQECNPNIQNQVGSTPLHDAVRREKKDTITKLLSCKKCDPNVQDKEGDTPLHIAVRQNNTHAISQLLSNTLCNPNILNNDGVTPLNIAIRHEQKDAIVQLLSCKECNPNAQNKEGDTPLHIACWMRLLDIIKLLLESRCSTNIHNKKGETAQNIPLNEDGDHLLHIACQWGDVDIVKCLITDERCNPNVQSSTSVNTPLHIAAKYGQDDAIVQLLSYRECDPNVQNKKGDTPLHISVKQNRRSAISHLLTCKQCNPNILNNDGVTPLHIAIRIEQKDTITKLLSCKKCDLNVQDNEGDTPLHIAARQNRTHAISQLLSNKDCNLNIYNKDHLTPLLIAIKYNNSSVATVLLQHNKCDPTVCDPHGNAPLHLACTAGETWPEMAELAKQLLTTVDPVCVNNAGQTPIELTTNYQLIQAITYMVKCKTKQSVQTYINMFIVGNPETGKSTLVKAICKEATSILWKIVPKWLRRVKNVPLHTAGIIPTTFQSKTFGNTVLYDLAGQVEYYTSHAAVIQSTVISTPPAFIVVVNLSESEEKISQTLRYWWSFIDNHAAQSSAPPEVILVGSHADVVKSTGQSVQEKMTQLSALLKKLSASFHFTDQVALDSRDPASKGLRYFCSLVNQSCSVLRQTADVDLRCHVLYAFLLERFQGKVACTVSDVATSIKETTALLPQNPDSLIPLISTLSDKGLLLLVKGGKSHGDWWVILQKQGLLGEINGTIFAPKSFSQHKDLSWSTGVVPFSKLKNEFPDYNPNMVSGFLTHLEFCFEIEDHVTLALLKDEATNVEDTSLDVSEAYYFFPALVSVDNPLDVWEQNEDMCCKCSWVYQCIQSDQFLSTQFLHVLILRLAFTFALKLDPGDCREDSLSLRRKCSVWKHGIGWLNRLRIETVVEVGLQYQSVIVMMRCPKGKEAKCAQLRSEVIQKVLEAKDEHCKAAKMSESFIHPTGVRYPFTDNMNNVKFYSLTEIARGIICKAEEANALDQRGRNPVQVQDLLLFDPHSTDTSSELLRELFSEKHSMDETVRSQVLETLNSESENACPLCIEHMCHIIFSSTV